MSLHGRTNFKQTKTHTHQKKHHSKGLWKESQQKHLYIFPTKGCIWAIYYKSLTPEISGHFGVRIPLLFATFQGRQTGWTPLDRISIPGVPLPEKPVSARRLCLGMWMGKKQPFFIPQHPWDWYIFFDENHKNQANVNVGNSIWPFSFPCPLWAFKWNDEDHRKKNWFVVDGINPETTGMSKALKNYGTKL